MRFVLQNFEKIICVALFAAMTLLGFVNVVVRYLTSYSLAASEELLTNGFLLLTIFGAAIAARAGDHLAVTLVYDLSPKPVRKLILLVATGLSALLLAMSAYFCWQLVTNQMASGIRSYALQIPAWYYSVGLPLGFALILIRYLQHARSTWSDDAPQEALHV